MGLVFSHVVGVSWWGSKLHSGFPHACLGLGTAGRGRELGTDVQGGSIAIPKRDHVSAAAAPTEGRPGEPGSALAPTPTFPWGEKFSVCAPNG